VRQVRTTIWSVDAYGELTKLSPVSMPDGLRNCISFHRLHVAVGCSGERGPKSALAQKERGGE
jgi:hypothetical protein